MAKHKMKSTSTSKAASINAKYEVKCRGKKITESLLPLSFWEDTEDDGTESDTNKNGKAGMALSTIVS